MRVKARVTTYSSIVDGVTLTGDAGRVVFQVAVIGMSGITWEQSRVTSDRIAELINHAYPV